MSRVLWIGDAGCHTGFGKVTHEIGERLVRDYGHEIHVLAINHRGDAFPSVLDPNEPTPLRLYMPTQLKESDTYGMTRVVELLGRLGESPKGLDSVVMLNDPQVLLQYFYENPMDPTKYLLQYRPVIAYIPCDGVNLPPLWTDILPQITTPVTMSKWGQKQYEPSSMVYHGVNTDRFWPIAEKPITLSNGTVCRTKRDCKKAFGFDPEGFMIGRVDKNSGRKDYGALLRVLGPLMKKHKDIQVHLHCDEKQNAHGVNIPLTLSRWLTDDDLRQRVFQPSMFNSYIGWTEQDLNGLYNAFDVFVSTSRGEGFGLTLAEAASCAIPVVAQNVSAIPEVVGPGGILVEPSGVMVTVPSGEDLWMPDVDAFSQAIETLYSSRAMRRRLGEAGMEHVRKSFSWDVAASAFHEYISGHSPVQEVLTHG